MKLVTRMSEGLLTAVVDDKIWTLFRPVWFGGVRLRARTTVLRLDNGSLLLHSPAPPTDALAEQLRGLGLVRWQRTGRAPLTSPAAPRGFHLWPHRGSRSGSTGARARRRLSATPRSPRRRRPYTRSRIGCCRCSSRTGVRTRQRRRRPR